MKARSLIAAGLRLASESISVCRGGSIFRQLRKNSHPGPKPRTARLLPARSLPTARTHRRNLRRVRRRTSGRSAYNYFRDYDPYTGRYLESDPIGLGGGINTYGYVEGRPVARSDKFGLLSCDGRWRRMGELVPTLGAVGWQTLPSPSCKCFWLCTSCNGQDVWSGSIYSLPSTWGSTVVIYGGTVNPGSGGIRPTPTGPSGGPSATAGGSAQCACRSPGPEKGCSQCYPNSRYPDGPP